MLIDPRTAILAALVAPLLPISALLWMRSPERAAMRFFIAWLGCWGLLTTPMIIGFANVYDAYPSLTFAPFETSLWLGPLIWLFTLALTSARLPARWWCWLLPGALQTLYYLVCWLGIDSVAAKFAYAREIYNPYIAPAESGIAALLGALCVTLSWRQSTRYRYWLSRHHSAMRDFDLSSLRLFVVTMTVLIVLWLCVEAWQIAFGRLNYSEVAYVLMVVGTAVLLLAMDMLASVQRAYPKMDVVAESEPTAQRAAGLPDVNTIRATIRTEGWYRRPDLTIAQLAREFATNESSMSAVINAVPDNNFNALINGIRLEVICQKLLDSNEPRTVIALAFAYGFGSKATFNRTFKERVGMTPSQFKRANDTSQIPDFSVTSGI
ncbi:MAG: helix-turn-helix transcriptional regulator [Pseudomonadota bacterium]